MLNWRRSRKATRELMHDEKCTSEKPLGMNMIYSVNNAVRPPYKISKANSTDPFLVTSLTRFFEFTDEKGNDRKIKLLYEQE